MIPVTSFNGKHVALFGLGGSGMATARALEEGGADVTVWDDAKDRVEAALAKGLRAKDLVRADWNALEAGAGAGCAVDPSAAALDGGPGA
jgi:UDP-N-acetylmuramoylalanine--D-glutamate ligase